MASPIRSGRTRTVSTLASPAATPALAGPTPEELAELQAQEAAVAAPVPEPVAAPVDLNAGPTPQELAELQAQEAAPTAQPFNAATDMTATELAEIAAKDPTFILDQEFKKNLPQRLGAFGKRRLDATLAESQEYNKLVEKFADAEHQIKERGFTIADLPSPGKIGTALKDFVVGVGKYAKPFLASAAGADADPLQRAENQRGILEGAAATEASLTGLGTLAKQTAGKVSRGIGLSKPLNEWTLEEKVKSFTNKLKRGETQEATLRGEGPVMGAVAQEALAQTQAAGLPIRPEEVGAKAAGDPFAIYAFGKVMGAGGKLVPAPIKAAARAVEQKLVEVAPKIVGRAITGAADLTSGTARVVERTAPTVGAVAGAIKGAEMGGIPGAVIGAGAGRTGGVAVARGAAGVRGVAEKVAGLGEQVSGVKPMVSSYAQLVRSVAESAPGAARAAGEGFGMDVGLAAVSSESPQDTEGAINIGTALGVLGGLSHTASRITSGQIVAPRSYGVNAPIASSPDANPALRSMHAEAFSAKTPAERANINATRKLMQDTQTGTELFVGKDAAAVEAALVASGVDPARARELSQAEGFFTVDLPGKDGQPRKVVIAQNVAAVPHESFHAIQDVLGEPANRAIDELVKRDYADQWDNEGNKYADRFGARAEGKTWEEIVLDKSGWGRAELADKMFRELTASNEAQGNPPNPELIKRLVTAEIARLEAEKGGDPQNVWAGELSAEEAKLVADRYLAREIAAENFDAAFKNLGVGLKEGTALPQRLARIAAAVIAGLGGNPLQGVTSELGQIELRPETQAAVREAARGRLPVIEVKAPTAPGAPTVTPRTPAAPRPGSPAAGVPVTPEQISEAATDAQIVADAAPDVVAPGAPAGSETPRAMLGTIAQAIADRSGVKINYRSAPGEPAGATTSNRTARRTIIEAFRTMPESARALWEKNFFPERVISLKDGKYQVMGWSPEVFAANAHKMAGALIAARKGDFSPYALDPQTGSFTAEGWQRLYEDTQKFVENQASGRTGAGEELVVPRSVIDAGGYKPPVTGEAKTLGQPEADFINMLFNFKIPETPRMQKGQRPRNIIGQEVSEATAPGRVEIPVRPRGEFIGQEAEAQGIAGRPIMEVNPTRNQIEAALGENMPSMVEAIQRLNLESINDVAITPEQPQFRGNTLALTAGLAPAATKSGRRLDERGFSFTRRITDEGTSIAITKDGVKVGKIDAEPRGATGAYVSGIQIEPAFRNQGISEILYRELGQELKTQGKTEVTGNIVSPKAVTARAKGFAGTEFSSSEGGFADAAEAAQYIEEGGLDVRAKSRITADSQFAPKRLANSAKDTEFDVTHFSSKFGLKEVSPKFFGKGKATPTDLRGDPKAYFFVKGSKLGQDAPIFKDAGLEEYSGKISGSDLYDLRKGKEDPLNWRGTVDRSEADAAVKKAGYRGIVLDTQDGRKVIAMFKATRVSPTSQMSPGKESPVQDVAREYAEKAGIKYAPKGGVRTPDETMLRDVGDFYEAAKHAPEDPKVKASYDALADETVAQYDAITDAGYTIEPWTGEGEPYKTSAEMTKDVQENKHLFYKPTVTSFSGASDNLMLRPSGVEINGQELPVNDVFRAVHDFFGHAKEDYQFGPRGEFSAWRAHADMYSPEAQGALAGETLAQNAWVNYGPQMRGEGGAIPKKGEPGFVPLADRQFAEQKNIVVPASIIDLGKAQFAPSTDPRAVKIAAVKDPEGRIFTGVWHGEAVVKAMTAGSDGDLIDGFVTNDGEFLDRDQAFARAKELEQIPRSMPSLGGLESHAFRKGVSGGTPERWEKKDTKASVNDILAMSAPEWNIFMAGYRGEFSDSATGIAMDIGKNAKTPEAILALKTGADIATERYNKARAAGDLDTAMAEAMRKQTFNEAIQTAEGTRPVLEKLGSKTQLQPKKKGYIADEMWLGRDKLTEAPEGHLEWAIQNFPDKDNATPTYRDQDSYERANAAGYLRVTGAPDALFVDPSPKYPTWKDVPRRFKEALEDYAADHNIEIKFSGRTVVERPEAPVKVEVTPRSLRE